MMKLLEKFLAGSIMLSCAVNCSNCDTPSKNLWQLLENSSVHSSTNSSFHFQLDSQANLKDENKKSSNIESPVTRKEKTFLETEIYYNESVPLEDLEKEYCSDKDLRTIMINKSKRKLSLYCDDKKLKEYPAAFGFDPVNDKTVEGDGRTPEGEFFVVIRHRKNKYQHALEISYPNKEDAERGLKDGIISKREYININYNIDHGMSPPQNTKLGSHIQIHGGGSGYNWTLGCIALNNDDIREIFSFHLPGFLPGYVPRTKIIIEH